MREAPHASSADLCLVRHGAVDCGDTTFPGITDVLDLVTKPAVCVVRVRGTVACRDERGHVVTVPRLDDAIALASGGALTCAIERSGGVRCAVGGDVGHWRALAGVPRVRALALSRASACAVTADNEIACYDLHGVHATPIRAADHPALDLAQFHGASKIAMERDADEPLPVAIVEGTVVVYDGERTRTLANLVDAIAITSHCALRAQGSVVCWNGDGPPLAVPL